MFKCLRLTFFFFKSGDQKPSQHQPELLIPQCNVPKILSKPQAVPNLFTSTPVSSRFRTPIFQSKDSKKDLDHCINSAAVPVHDQSLKNQTESPSQPSLPPIAVSPVKVPAPCLSDQETSVLGPEDVDEEDQSIFYTPELFEGEDERSAMEKDEESGMAVTEEMPFQVEPLCAIGKMPDGHPEELFRPKTGQTRTCADTIDIKVASMVPKRDCVSPNRDFLLSESVAEQAGVSCSAGSEDRVALHQPNSSTKSRRLSRSRQKASSREAGKHTSSQGHCNHRSL